MNETAAILRSRIDALLASRARTGAVREALSAVADGLPVLDLYDLVLVPLLVDTGTRWQHGTTRVWEEHFASATVRTIVEALYPTVMEQAATVTPTGKTALLACPPHEQHDLGLRMLADRFALAGWSAQFLGTDTPVDEICDAAVVLGADVIVLSASTHFNRVHLRDVVDRVKAGAPNARVVVGGPAFALDHNWPAGELLSYADLGLAKPARPGA